MNRIRFAGRLVEPRRRLAPRPVSLGAMMEQRGKSMDAMVER